MNSSNYDMSVCCGCMQNKGNNSFSSALCTITRSLTMPFLKFYDLCFKNFITSDIFKLSEKYL